MGRGKSPFRFENMWLKSKGFIEKVKSWWDWFLWKPSYVLVKKLKALKEDLKQWTIRESENLGVNKKKLLGELLKLDAKVGIHGLIEKKSSWELMKVEVKRLISMEVIFWRHKSKVLWLNEGDNNSKFFCRIVNSRRRHNHLGMLEVDGWFMKGWG